ncbi:hypothetical protein AGABI1DRAFT_109140 [Agaricus bisporus var. burnettii JB137-S8]|uniref:Uncharacterized protein n=1 Tax=Agaricus bisporus var. burnettii (strain JB137-S8 / ATCC MYA-4627 / FGSC 10392) TaxID=597362 RepID=K5VN69_AGABU|nr:uncharacterized protein AGABI1DRAFT_109140 [Agaricus bisporus var. burnettii JB137-S8]EKM75904.1 hypothetical protein AGABI1DRAFT_109140 [Agaricus bisporus var. burnettii JB137-S8]
MFDFGVRARTPQSSKARQWVEVRDWWSHSVLLTNANGRVGLLTTTQTTEGDFYLAPLTVVPRRCCSGVGVWQLGMTRRYASSRHCSRSPINKIYSTNQLGEKSRR